MKTILARLAATLLALALTSAPAAAQTQGDDRGRGAPACAISRPCWQSNSASMTRLALPSELVDLKGGSDALRAVLGGSADVVSVISTTASISPPRSRNCNPLSCTTATRRGAVCRRAHQRNQIDPRISRARKSASARRLLDRFLSQISPEEKRHRSSRRCRDRRRPRATRGGNGARPDRCAVMLDPSVTVLQGSHPDLAHPLRHAHPERYARGVGRRISGGALYSTTPGSPRNEKEFRPDQCNPEHAGWIHAHTAEEINGEMPPEIVGKNKSFISRH